MLENRVRRALELGEPTFGCWMSLSSPAVAELLSSCGADWLVIDTEHSPTTWETAEDMIRGMAASGVVPLVRVAGNEPYLIKRALDRGALGILIPQITTPEEAVAAVASSRYPPEGIRGAAGTRVNLYGAGLGKYVEAWNRQVLVVCQIETAQAVERIDSIAAVPGVDVLFIGPTDLSLSLGVFLKFDHKVFVGAVERTLQAARHHKKAAGIMVATVDEALVRVNEGFQFIAIGSDARILYASTSSLFEQIRRNWKSLSGGA